MRQPGVLLQCDIVDSTALSSRLDAPALAALWQRHDREARDLIRRWRGREIDKSDGFLLLFAAADDALGFALDYHACLAGIDDGLQARVGIHAGDFAPRANPAEDIAHGAKPVEIDGMGRFIVARAMAVAPAGETVLSEPCARALSAGQAVRPLGHWRLKGLPEPLALYTVGAMPAELHLETPKAHRVVRSGDLWLPASAVPHSLPAEHDRFVGRSDDLDTLRARFDGGARLVTLAGMGGSGKTRMAQRYGWTALGDHPGGVWFCDLSQARSLDAAAFAVAQGLGLPLAQGEPVAQLAQAIAGRGDCLLILDNFEQITALAADTIGAWLAAAPQAKLLVTSREVLGLPGETVLPLPPLSADDAAALFALRAEAATGSRPSDGASVAALVELVDRLPLAIELAAARARLMTAAQMLARMRDRFSLLAARTGRAQRHATLRATIDWSWELLTPAERSALAQLSVFEGGIALDAGEAVLDMAALPSAPPVADLLQSLAEKSLLRPRGGGRFDLLMSVREYAADRLTQPGAFPGSGTAMQAAVIERHWRHFGALDEAQCIADGCAEAENLIAACQRAVAAADGEAAGAALLNAWHVLALRGPYATGEQMARAVLRITAASATVRSRALYVVASALFMLGDSAGALEMAGRGLSGAAPNEDAATAAELYRLRAELLTKKSRRDEAAADLACADSLARRVQRSGLICRIINAQALLAADCADHAQARSHFEQGLQAAQAAGDARWEAGFLGNLALIDYAEGKPADCLARYEHALTLSRACGDIRWEGNAACNVGLLLFEQKELGRARTHLDRALQIARLLGHRRLECTATCNLALVKEGQGELDAAMRDFESAVALAIGIGDHRNEVEVRIPQALAYARAGRVGDAMASIGVAESVVGATADLDLERSVAAARQEVSRFASPARD